MRFVTDEESKKEYKKFLEGHERCNFQQSIEWAKVKDNWKNEIILAEDENKNNNRINECINKKNTYIWKYNVFIKRTSM